MKKVFVLFFLVFPLMVSGQDYSGNWEGFFSFFEIKDLSAGNNQVFAASENALFSTNLATEEQKEITTLDGLSGQSISSIYFAEGYQVLLIGYENGLLQIYDARSGKIRTVIDIVQKLILTPDQRKINGFYVKDHRAFIAANYGVSIFDLNNMEFGDTFYIGDFGTKLGVNAVAVHNNFIYAATQGDGIRYANLNNLAIVDFDLWHQYDSGHFKNIDVFKNNIYALTEGNDLKRLVGNTFQSVLQLNANIRSMKSGKDFLTLTSSWRVFVLDENINTVAEFSTDQFSADFNSGLTLDGRIYVGDRNFGLIRTRINNLQALEYLSPNGPLRNDPFSIDVYNGNLWVVYGEHNFFYNPYPLRERGISHYKEGSWINYPYSELPNPNRSIIDVLINPQNTEQVFFASYHDGLMEIQNEEVANFYTVFNSNLTPTDSPAESPDAVRLGRMAFDQQGNLWMGSALAYDGLVRFPAGGGSNSFVKYDITDIISNPLAANGIGDLVFDAQGNVYFGSYDDGVIGFKPSTQKFAKIKGGVGQGNLANDYVRSLAIDHNGQMWIGTSRGLRVLFGPARMFDNPSVRASNIVIIDPAGVPRELFADLPITTMAVDGNNNKWIGSSAGVYYVSSDGQETIYHFTVDNSPLPDNNINRIKIDGATGKVYIATSKGLVAFLGKAKDPSRNLDKLRAYPNPVRPGYQGMVTIDGLMRNANVKITDIEGNLVYEEIARGGSIQWDTTAFGRYRVATGVYLVMVTSDDQKDTKIAKIMIVR